MEKVGLLGASKEKEEDSIRTLSSQMTDRKKEPIVKVQVRPRRGGKFIVEKWLADSGVKRTLMLEASSLEMNKENTGLVLKRNRVKFKPYGTQVILPVSSEGQMQGGPQEREWRQQELHGIRGGRPDGVTTWENGC